MLNSVDCLASQGAVMFGLTEKGVLRKLIHVNISSARSKRTLDSARHHIYSSCSTNFMKHKLLSVLYKVTFFFLIFIPFHLKTISHFQPTACILKTGGRTLFANVQGERAACLNFLTVFYICRSHVRICKT